LSKAGYQRWKELERKAARKLGGKRLWRARDWSESVPDGETETDVWDCKDRVAMTCLSWYRSSERKYRRYIDGRRFLLILGDRGGNGAYVLLPLEDYANLLGELESARDE
jgi:hypothetical protein